MAVKDREPAERKETPAEEIREGIMGFTNTDRGKARSSFSIEKEMRPEGAFVREACVNVPRSDSVHRNRIHETGKDSYECHPCANQNLTFKAAKEEFARRNVKFDATQRRTLKLTDPNGLFTNLGLLLSDQCEHTIHMGVFQGVTSAIARDRREFGGSLCQQMNDAYAFLDFCNQTHSTFEKLLRIDVRDYPEAALQEALLSLIVHRDYTFSPRSFIRMYEDRIEFLSVDSMMPGIEQKIF